MADLGQKTEKPTPRRLEKARKEGQFPQTRELLSAGQLVLLLVLLTTLGAAWLTSAETAIRRLLVLAFHLPVTPRSVASVAQDSALRVLSPLGLAGGAVLLLTIGLHAGFTRMGFSLETLMPKAERFNVVSRIRQLSRDGLFGALWATLLFATTAVLLWFFLDGEFRNLLVLSRAPVRIATGAMFDSLGGIVWRLGFLFALVGSVDFFRRYGEHRAQLRMSRQEIRDEVRDMEGRPEVRHRIRMLQRQLGRRQMMSSIPTATAIVVNPTHFAVALRYDVETMPAPVVVAKGKNYLALRIRARGLEHGIPMIENPPLARALYGSAQVGQEIPANLYRAVAEVLAWVYGLMDQRLRR